MGKQELDNLVKIGNLKVETASRKEFDGMVKSARRGLERFTKFWIFIG